LLEFLFSSHPRPKHQLSTLGLATTLPMQAVVAEIKMELPHAQLTWSLSVLGLLSMETLRDLVFIAERWAQTVN
jgi:hypothetical protein